ncbi:MAG: NusG domain II-containing protein [Oscillospiraceae bacterium]|nr:NusG domain II-containing protein [Oscillospiraceae bacterium]
MKQKVILFGIFLCLILIGIGGSYFVMHRPITNRTVVITQDGEELYRIAMNTIKEPYTIDISGKDGAWNRVLISKESVQMDSASCPDGLCVHQGAISDGVLPIVCLPNRVQIQIIETTNVGTEEELDAKVG